MKKRILLLGTCLTLSLSACTGSSYTLPDMSALGEITAVAREEGSGTRSEFETLVGTGESGADKIAFSTDEVLELVAADENAIGYLAASTASMAGGVKLLSVDGIAPYAQTIANSTYPLCRQYILAYVGELSDLENDFIRYLRGAGQEIAAKTCTPVRSTTTFLSDRSSGTVTVTGSSSMAPLMEELARDYLTYNPNAQIIVTATDSSDGLNAALRGDCDLAMSSRSLKDYEAELLETVAIASDGVAVVVNSVNPLDSITMKQLKAVYDGNTGRWTDMK